MLVNLVLSTFKKILMLFMFVIYRKWCEVPLCLCVKFCIIIENLKLLFFFKQPFNCDKFFIKLIRNKKFDQNLWVNGYQKPLRLILTLTSTVALRIGGSKFLSGNPYKRANNNLAKQRVFF